MHRESTHQRHPAHELLRGDIIGSLTFQLDGHTLPEYIPAKISIIATGILAICGYWFCLGCYRANRKRNKGERDAVMSMLLIRSLWIGQIEGMGSLDTRIKSFDESDCKEGASGRFAGQLWLVGPA